MCVCEWVGGVEVGREDRRQGTVITSVSGHRFVFCPSKLLFQTFRRLCDFVLHSC